MPASNSQAAPIASTKPQGKVQLVYSSNGRTYGNIEGRVLRKNVDRSRHFLRKPPAIAIETYILTQYGAQFDTVEIKDRESGDLYRASRATVETHGFDPNRGYEPQKAVPLSCWHHLPAWSAATPPPTPVPLAPPVAPTGPKAPPTGSLFD